MISDSDGLAAAGAVALADVLRKQIEMDLADAVSTGGFTIA
jgi:hypothetical protein